MRKLFAYPGFGVELGGFVAQLEVQHTIARVVLGYGADDIASLQLLTFLYDDRG